MRHHLHGRAERRRHLALKLVAVRVPLPPGDGIAIDHDVRVRHSKLLQDILDVSTDRLPAERRRVRERHAGPSFPQFLAKMIHVLSSGESLVSIASPYTGCTSLGHPCSQSRPKRPVATARDG